MFHVHFLTCCVRMTRCGPRDSFVFINFKLYINGFYFCYQTTWHRMSVWTRCAKEEKIQLVIFYTTVHNKCYQPSELLQNNTNRYGYPAKDVWNSRQNFDTDCLQWVKILELIVPFDILLSSGYCLIKNIKWKRELLIVWNENLNSISFV